MLGLQNCQPVSSSGGVQLGCRFLRVLAQDTLSFLTSGVLDEEQIFLCLLLGCLCSWEIVKQSRICLLWNPDFTVAHSEINTNLLFFLLFERLLLYVDNGI